MKIEKDVQKAFHTRREFMKISGVSAGALCLGSLVNLSDLSAKVRYPADKLVFIVPYPAGGGYDLIARMITPYLSKHLRELSSISKGGDFIIKNEPGSAGRKGRSMIMNAKPDGNTLGLIDTSTITDNIIDKTELDLTQLTFLQLAVSTNKVIIASNKGFKSWDEAVEATKKETVKMMVGAFGRSGHICAIIMNEAMGTKFKLIQSPGTAASVGALIRGDVQTVMVSEESVKPLVDANEVRVLMVFADATKYSGAVTSKELGFPELANQIRAHRFIVAPPALEKGPKNILIAALKKASTDKEFLSLAVKQGIPVRNDTFGKDAEDMFLKYKKFYDDIAPMLKKQLV